MHEIRTAIHLNTTYSSGTALHKELLEQAAAAGLDCIITTDHNVLVQNLDSYTHVNDHTCLLLTAETVFDRRLQPPRNRLLVLGADRELSPYASTSQQVLRKAKDSNAFTLLAHPFAPQSTALGRLLPPWDKQAIPDEFNGIEVWNSLSESQRKAPNRVLAGLLALFPRLARRGPHPEACQFWDERLASGEKITAIAGSGCGMLPRAGKRLQDYLLAQISNHLLVPRPLNRDPREDKQLILDALRSGRSYIACDDLAPTAGFRFSAKGRDDKGTIGDTVILKDSVTFQIRLPFAAKCVLYNNGTPVQTWEGTEICVHNSTVTGAYRVEVFLQWLGQDITWILTNPIYVRPYIPPPLRDQLYDSY